MTTFLNGTIAQYITYIHPDITLDNGKNVASYFIIIINPQMSASSPTINVTMSLTDLFLFKR
jgi:hypothetical protein